MIHKLLRLLMPEAAPDNSQEKVIAFFKNRTEDIIIRSENEKDRDEWERYHYALNMIELHNRKAVEVFTCLFQDENHPLEDFEDYENRLRLYRLEIMKERILWAANQEDKTGYYEWGRDLAQLYKKLLTEQSVHDFSHAKNPQKKRQTS